VIGKHEVMSLKAAVWAEAQPLSGRKKQLLLAIASAVDETGACRSMTQDDLAASCGCTVRQVRRLVGELAAERYLAHRRRGRRRGGRAADLYVLPREAREDSADEDEVMRRLASQERPPAPAKKGPARSSARYTHLSAEDEAINPIVTCISSH
jgi:hypothetical protein